MWQHIEVRNNKNIFTAVCNPERQKNKQKLLLGWSNAFSPDTGCDFPSRTDLHLRWMEDVVEKVERQATEESWPAQDQHHHHGGNWQLVGLSVDVLQDHPLPQVHDGGNCQTVISITSYLIVNFNGFIYQGILVVIPQKGNYNQKVIQDLSCEGRTVKLDWITPTSSLQNSFEIIVVVAAMGF